MISENVGNKKALADLENIQKVLAGDGRFFCEIYRCNMLKSACVARQENAEERRGKGMPVGRYAKPGVMDINCQNCEQGRGIMKEKAEGEKAGRSEGKIKEEASGNTPGNTGTGGTSSGQSATATAGKVPENMKICTSKKCPHSGKPQPLDDFDNSKKAKDGKASSCKDCRRRMQAEWRERKNATKKKPVRPRPADRSATNAGRDEKEETDTKSNISNTNPNTLTIDFSEHLHTLESIKKIAKSEIRTPESQVLYWLTTFSVLVQKKEG